MGDDVGPASWATRVKGRRGSAGLAGPIEVGWAELLPPSSFLSLLFVANLVRVYHKY